LRRIELAVILAVGLTLVPLAAEAQPAAKVWRIGYLGNSPFTPNTSFLLAAFTDGLREYGYVEGQNLTIEFRFAYGREERYPELVRELLQANVELVVTVQTSAALALKRGLKRCPLFCSVPAIQSRRDWCRVWHGPVAASPDLATRWETWTASSFSSRGSSSRGCRVSQFYGIPPITPRHTASTP